MPDPTNAQNPEPAPNTEPPVLAQVQLNTPPDPWRIYGRGGLLGAAIGFCIGVSALLIVKSSFPKPEDPLAGWKKPEWVENDGNKKAFRGWIMNLGMLSSSSILGGIAGTRVSETLKRKQR